MENGESSYFPPDTWGESVTAKELREALRRLGLSQTEFARLLTYYSGERVSPNTVWRWAAGHRRVPSGVVMAVKLFEALPKSKQRRIRREAAEQADD